MTLELLVACVLLVTSASLVTTCAFAAQKIARDTRQRTVAQHELTNQLERLTQVPAAELAENIEDLDLSEIARQSIPDATLSGKVIDDEYGQRIQLELAWKQTGVARPITAVAWLKKPADTEGDNALQ